MSGQTQDRDNFEGMARVFLPLAGLLLFALISISAVLHLTAHVWTLLRGDTYTATYGDTLSYVVDIPRHGSHPELAFASNANVIPHGTGWFILFVPPVLLSWLLIAVVAMWVMDNVKRRKHDKSAVWARRSDIRQLIVSGPTASRGILGRTPSGKLLATEENHSTIVFGPTQSGKSTGFTIPLVLEHDGPAIVLSVKTDLAQNSFMRRKELGKVWVYDPVDCTHLPQQTGWSPLHRCRTWGGAMRTAAWLATASQAKLNDRESEFWADVARQLLEPLLFAAALSDLTMEDVVRWIETHDRTVPEARLEQALENDVDDKTAKHINAAIQKLKAAHAADSRTVSGAYTTAQTILKAYGDPLMQDCRVDESFKPSQLLSGSNTLYICAPSTEQEYLRPIFATIVKDVLTAAFDEANRRGGKLERPLLVMLDEAANLARIPDLDTIASTGASHGIQLVTVLQSYAQMIEKWGRDRSATIFDNHRAKVLLKGSTDGQLLEHFAKLLGDESIDQSSHTRSRNGVSTTHSSQFRPLQAMHELRSMPDETGLLLYGNLPPARIALRPYYKDPDLRALARPVA